MVFNRRGTIWQDFEREFEEMNRLMDRMMSGFRNWDWSAMPTREPVYYGVSLELGPDGVPRVQQFGNVRPGGAGLIEGGVREPFVTTVLDQEKNKVRLTAEMPGVDKNSIKVEAAEDALTLRAEGEGRKYEKTLRLRVPVNPDSAHARFNNGVLEVTLDLKEPIRPKGKEVPIE